jgi:IS30 family transposase
MAKILKNKKKHLRKEERFCIEKMLRQKKSLAEIGRVLDRGLSTIGQEVNQNGGRNMYQGERAHHRAYLKQYRKKRDCNKVAMNGHLSRFVERKLEQGWSPETIRDRLIVQSGLEVASAKSIRKYIKKRSGLERFLFWGRNNIKGGSKRIKETFLIDTGRKSIDLRPWQADFEYGHFEGDFIVSKHNSFVLLVLVEKWSKTTLLKILPNRNNHLVNQAVVSMLSGLKVKTLTLDNDIAFSKWRKLEQSLEAEIYFTHPFHSWEKGLVENTNRWLREFIKKSSDLNQYTKKYIRWIEAWFNHTPRQCLEGRTPYEIMGEKENIKVGYQLLEVNLPRLRIWG